MVKVEICIEKQNSLSSIFRMINVLLSFFLWFLRYADFFPRIFWTSIGMSDWCFFFIKSIQTVLKKKK